MRLCEKDEYDQLIQTLPGDWCRVIETTDTMTAQWSNPADNVLLAQAQYKRIPGARVAKTFWVSEENDDE
ncbi:MAG: hypothetical protein EOM24_16235 [Chloroflexia bacterium]|nr:hypothetical protein [Chloroflexia bacterium]